MRILYLSSKIRFKIKYLDFYVKLRNFFVLTNIPQFNYYWVLNSEHFFYGIYLPVLKRRNSGTLLKRGNKIRIFTFIRIIWAGAWIQVRYCILIRIRNRRRRRRRWRKWGSSCQVGFYYGQLRLYVIRIVGRRNISVYWRGRGHAAFSHRCRCWRWQFARLTDGHLVIKIVVRLAVRDERDGLVSLGVVIKRVTRGARLLL